MGEIEGMQKKQNNIKVIIINQEINGLMRVHGQLKN